MTAHVVIEEPAQKLSNESVYRTQWLIAHNVLHHLFHEGGLLKSETFRPYWERYLSELQDAERTASERA